MRRAKTPSHKVCSSVVVTHLKVASSSVPSYSALFFVVVVSGREPGRGYTSTPRKQVCMGTTRV